MNISITQAVHESRTKLLYKKEVSSITLTGGASDNRLVKDGDIFVCIKGNIVDGHDFAEDAMERGARAVLAERNPFEEKYGDNPPIPVLLTSNSVHALGLLANNRRNAYGEDASRKVIGITGTAGKTSLKELLAHILSIDENTLQSVDAYVAKTPMNYNTQIGMPIAILNARGDEKFWVLEIGISQAHDMDELGAILEPDLAIILNAASGHTEGLGDFGVAHYKARILQYVKKNGIAIVSKDYPDLLAEAQKYRDDIIYFTTAENGIEKGIEENCATPLDLNSPRGLYKGLDTNGRGQYCLNIQGEESSVSSSFIGACGAENCIAAAYAAFALGISKKIILTGIETMPVPKMRFNRIQKNAWTIIDDSYNANPLSSIRMLESAKELAKGKTFFVLMGEMKELGKLTQSEHIILGEAIAKSEVEILFWVGNQTEAIQQGLLQSNFTGKFIPVQSSDEFILEMEKSLTDLNEKEKLILFKGSRSNHLENYVTSFTEKCDAL